MINGTAGDLHGIGTIQENASLPVPFDPVGGDGFYIPGANPLTNAPLPGYVIVDLSGNDEINDVLVDAAGNVVLFGTDGADAAIARYSAGAPDPNFAGGSGVVLNDLGGNDTALTGVMQADGNLLSVGTDGTNAAISRSFGAAFGLCLCCAWARSDQR